MKSFSEEIFEYLKCLEDRSFMAQVEGAPSLEAFHVLDAKGGEVVVVPVPLRFFEEGGRVEELRAIRKAIVPETIFIYEDRWQAAGPLVRSMLAVRLGRGESVYARNCEVREIPAEVAAEFLERNHLYGATRSAYRYGLFRRRSTGRNEAQMMDTASLVAVATFSAGKLFSAGGVSGSDGSMSPEASIVGDKHATSVISYEWIRYASAKGTRVVGGMGRLLEAFVSQRKQEALSSAMARQLSGNDSGCTSDVGQEYRSSSLQVMSYADMEWTTGESYSKLGFEEAGERGSVEFLCDPATMQRVHAGKFSTDRKFQSLSTDGYIRLWNLGSRKFIRQW